MIIRAHNHTIVLYMTEKGDVRVNISHDVHIKEHISMSWTELQGIGLAINRNMPELKYQQGLE